MALTPRRLFTAIFLIALFVMAMREIADPDFWWHLRTGQFILETGSIPQVDVFSYTKSGQPWVAHEWLSEVLIYSIYRLGSFPALILAFSAIVALAFGLVLARSEGKPYVAALAVLLAALATAPTWGVRPQILSLLLTSTFLWILERHSRPGDSSKSDRGLWLLIPLTVLWVNLHSGYALGLAVIAVYVFGEAVQAFGSSYPSGWRWSRFHNLAIVFVLCLLVVPLNPNGATMYAYPFETLGSHAMQTYIQEWFSPDFHLLEWQPFAWLLLGTLAAIALSGKRVRLTNLLLLVALAYAGLRSARLVPMFALVAAPVLAEHTWSILEMHGSRWAKGLKSTSRVSRSMSLVNWLILLGILIAAALRAGMVIGNQQETEMEKYPAAAVSFVKSQQLVGLLYNAYDWGGYLIWQLYPAQRVFIDGRADVYGDAFIEEFLETYQGGANWRVPLDRYGVQVILVEPGAPIVGKLAQDAAWRQVYEDKQAVIFRKE
jgi:hypothetical protein